MAKQWRDPEQGTGRHDLALLRDLADRRCPPGQRRVAPRGTLRLPEEDQGRIRRKPGQSRSCRPGRSSAPNSRPGWQKTDFDDSGWSRQPGPFDAHYRSLALICMRGKFEVCDPAQVSDLTLDLLFQGGAIAYVNGQEIGRAGLPAGALAPDTLADPYPIETDQSGEKLWYGLISAGVGR